MNAPITSFRDPEVITLTAAALEATVTNLRALVDTKPTSRELAAMTAGLVAIADCIPPARTAEKIAADLADSPLMDDLNALIGDAHDTADWLSNDDEAALACFMVEELRALHRAAGREIARLAAARAAKEAAQTMGEA